MSDSRKYFLVHETARNLAKNAIDEAADGYVCKIEPPSRTLDQNAYQWPYLEGFSMQVMWPVNGVLTKLTKDEWKDILTAAFEKETEPRLAAGFDGGIVMLGRRTSKFGKKKFALWMEFLIAAAALKNVKPVFKYGEYIKFCGGIQDFTG